jgi:hypothetical protein
VTHKQCDILADQLAVAERIGTEIDTSSPYYNQSNTAMNVFYKRTSTTGKDLIWCNQGFDERYEKPASEGGQYPTRQDFNNIFHIGVDHGKFRSFGMPNLWDASVSSTLDGYPFKSIVYDEDGNRFISRVNGNKQPLPKKGEKSNYWVPIKPIPSFMHKVMRSSPKWNRLDIQVSYMNLDVDLPLKTTTTKLLVKKFTGRDLGFSGVMVFVDALATDYNRYEAIAELDPPTLIENYEVTRASFSMKLSQYPDIYENEDHADSFIEVFSKSQYYKQVPNKSIYWDYRSPHILVPISLDTTYYLYMEFENAFLRDPFYGIQKWNSPYSIMTYKFPRTLCWPLDNP